jgi:hypothetical protein
MTQLLQVLKKEQSIDKDNSKDQLNKRRFTFRLIKSVLEEIIQIQHSLEVQTVMRTDSNNHMMLRDRGSCHNQSLVT